MQAVCDSPSEEAIEIYEGTNAGEKKPSQQEFRNPASYMVSSAILNECEDHFG